MVDYSALRTAMVDTQIRPSDVTKYPIIDAMLQVSRENFVSPSKRAAAYVGENLELDGDRVLLEPRTLAKMLDTLDIGPDELVLDIGIGYGYSSAVVSRLAQTVVAVEDVPGFVKDAQEALSDASADNVIIHEAPLHEGAAEHGPYDVILLQGGVVDIPAALLDQLKDGGRMAALFMDGALGEVRIGYKRDGQMSWRLAFNAAAPVLPGFEGATQFSL